MSCIFDPVDFNPTFTVVSCFLKYQDEILLLHRQDNKPEGNTWCMPAGKVEYQESLIHAIIREVREETGIKVKSKNLIYKEFFDIRVPNKDYKYYVYEVILEAKPKVRLKKDESKAFIWINPLKALSLNLIDGEEIVISKTYL